MSKPASITEGATFADMILDNLVHADAAYIADLVIDGRTAEADAYSQKPDVQARIRKWKDAKRS